MFEFFTSKSQNKKTVRINEFGANKYTSHVYAKWKESLNRHVLHLNFKRSKPNNLKNGEHLSEQVLVFSNEILRLWEKLENDPKSIAYKDAFCQARIKAINDAKNDTKGMFEPIFHE